MKPAALLMLLALLLTGCGAERAQECVGEYHAHATLTPEAHIATAAAFAKWNALAGREVIRLVPGDPSDTTCAVRVDEATGTLGLWQPSDGSISLAPARMQSEAPGCDKQLPDCIEATALHEAGHALGLQHVAGSGHVLSEGGELVLGFTPADQAECARVGVCVNSPSGR